MNLKTDKEFSGLIPPLSEDERQQLEENILADGCRDALVVWDGIIIDGHNRYEICQKHSLPFKTVDKHFDSREDAVAWIIRNQFGRRSLEPYVRAKLALRLKESIAAMAKAKEKQRKTTFQKSEKSSLKEINTAKEMARLAGMSHDTLSKAGKLEKNADEKTKEKLQKGEITINKAYNEMVRDEQKGRLKKCTVCGRELSADHFYAGRNQCTTCRSARQHKKKPEKLSPDGKTLDETIRDMKDPNLDCSASNDDNAITWIANAEDCAYTLQDTRGIDFPDVSAAVKKELAAVIEKIEKAVTLVKKQL